jgi:lipid II:glycine glycyltransferase (peptidoglycan interpeptide bridge formation enzyme)
LQLWGWGQVKTVHGWVAERFFAYDDDEIVACAQVLTRKLPFPFRAISYVLRGPLGKEGMNDAFLDLLADYVKRNHHSVALSVEPDIEDFGQHDGWKRANNSNLPSKTVVLDLKKSESDLLTGMVKKTRQYIRKSAAEAITIKQIHTKAEVEKCLDVYRNTSRRAKFNLHSNQYYLDVFNLMGDHSPLFAAYHNDQPIAFLWLAISADTSYELYGGMSEKGQELRTNYALKWYAIRKMKEWGISKYDFGGLIGDGVSSFKLGWTEGETSLAGTFDKPLSPLYGIWNVAFPIAKKISQRIGSLRR